MTKSPSIYPSGEIELLANLNILFIRQANNIKTRQFSAKFIWRYSTIEYNRHHEFGNCFGIFGTILDQN